ncbi:MAG: tetratricopeptide repeat protein [Elusimicrobiota bacterium]|nr:tetratricopeptide repeat protein [Elusimicrobiota bacterium]
MKKNLLKTSWTVLTIALAALLCTPPAGAKTHKKKAPKANPEAQRLMSAGLANLEKGETSAAISTFNKAARKEGSVSSFFLLGWAHYQRGFKLGSTEAADRDDAQSAIDAYAMALSLDPSLKGLPDASRLYFSMALCYEAVQSYDMALDAYKMAFRAAPTKVLIPMNAARLRLKMGDTAKAVSNIELAMGKAMKNGKGGQLRDAVRRDPAFAKLIADASSRKALGIASSEDGETVADLGVRGEELRDSVRDTAPKPVAPAQDSEVLEKIAQGNIEFKFRRYLTAVSAYNEALAIDQERMTLGAPQTAMIYEKIGTAYNKLGQSEVAIRTLQKALQQNPMNPSAHYQIALAYAMSGKTAVALNALKESLKACAGPNDLRRFVMQSKTDTELEAVRDLPAFRSVVSQYADRVALR